MSAHPPDRRPCFSLRIGLQDEDGGVYNGTAMIRSRNSGRYFRGAPWFLFCPRVAMMHGRPDFP